MYSMGKDVFRRCSEILLDHRDADGGGDKGRCDAWGRDVPIRIDRFTLVFPYGDNERQDTEDCSGNKKKALDDAMTQTYAEHIVRAEQTCEARRLVIEPSRRILSEALEAWCARRGWVFGRDLLLVFDGAAGGALPHSSFAADIQKIPPASVWPEVSYEILFRHAHLKWAMDELNIVTARAMYAVEEALARDPEASGFSEEEIATTVLPRLKEVCDEVCSVRVGHDTRQSDLMTWGVWCAAPPPSGAVAFGTVVKTVHNGLVQRRGGGNLAAAAAASFAPPPRKVEAAPSTTEVPPPSHPARGAFYLTCSRIDPRHDCTDFRIRLGVQVDIAEGTKTLRCGAGVLNARILAPGNWRRMCMLGDGASTPPLGLVGIGDLLVPDVYTMWYRDMDAHDRLVMRGTVAGRFDGPACLVTAMRCLWSTVAVALAEEAKARRDDTVPPCASDVVVSPRCLLPSIEYMRALLTLGEDVPVKRRRNDTCRAMDVLSHRVMAMVLPSIADPQFRSGLRSKWACAALKVATHIQMNW